MAVQAYRAPRAQRRSSSALGHPARELVTKYCVTCHNQELKTANLVLDTADAEQFQFGGDVGEGRRQAAQPFDAASGHPAAGQRHLRCRGRHGWRRNSTARLRSHLNPGRPAESSSAQSHRIRQRRARPDRGGRRRAGDVAARRTGVRLRHQRRCAGDAAGAAGSVCDGGGEDCAPGRRRPDDAARVRALQRASRATRTNRLVCGRRSVWAKTFRWAPAAGSRRAIISPSMANMFSRSGCRGLMPSVIRGLNVPNQIRDSRGRRARRHSSRWAAARGHRCESAARRRSAKRIHLYDADEALQVRVPVKAGLRQVVATIVKADGCRAGRTWDRIAFRSGAASPICPACRVFISSLLVGGPYDGRSAARFTQPPAHLRVPTRQQRATRRPARPRSCRRWRGARIAGRRPATTSRRCSRFYKQRRADWKFRRRHSRGARARARQSRFSVPHRGRSRQRRARRSLSDVGRRTGFALVVLPVEQHPRRPAARPGDQRQAARAGGSRSAGRAHARRSARARLAGDRTFSPNGCRRATCGC